MKTCKKCNILKPYEDFSKDSQKSDGYYSSCKRCKSIVNRAFYNKNLDNESERQKIKYRLNRDHCLHRSKEYNRQT